MYDRPPGLLGWALPAPPVGRGALVPGGETDMAGYFEDAKHELHRLVDQLPSEQVTAALRYLHHLAADPVPLSLLNAPPRR